MRRWRVKVVRRWRVRSGGGERGCEKVESEGCEEVESEEKRTWTEEDNVRGASTDCSGSTALRGMEVYTIVNACERNGRYINTNSAIINV